MDADAAKAALDRTMKRRGSRLRGTRLSRSRRRCRDAGVQAQVRRPARPDRLLGLAAYIYDTTAADGDLAKSFEKGNAAGTSQSRRRRLNKGSEKELTLDANADYWGGWDDARYDQAVFRVVPQPAGDPEIVSGGVTFVPRLAPSLQAAMASTDGVRTTQTRSFQNILAMLNTASGPLADVRLRQARLPGHRLRRHRDRHEGLGRRGKRGRPEGLLGYTTDVQQTTDKAAAEDLLAAGYGPGGGACADPHLRLRDTRWTPLSRWSSPTSPTWAWTSR